MGQSPKVTYRSSTSREFLKSVLSALIPKNHFFYRPRASNTFFGSLSLCQKNRGAVPRYTLNLCRAVEAAQGGERSH